MQSPLTRKIAGEVVLSDKPGSVLRKWREEFKISQMDMARHLNTLTVDILREMLAWVRCGDLYDAEEVNARAAAWTARVNTSFPLP